ncbi:MAG: glycosyltransferase family 4 protein [Pseudomonadota bacterium]
MHKKVVTVQYNTCDHVVKARIPLIKAIQKNGYRVIVVAPTDNMTPMLKDHGVEHVPIHMTQYGMNPFSEFRTFQKTAHILNKIKPIVSLNYTVKPNTFGTIAAEYAQVPVINNIAGAGMIFSSGWSIKRSIVSTLYRRCLKKSRVVFFQNSDDMQLFLDKKFVRRDQCHRLPGSGVDLKRFTPTEIPKSGVRFLFIGRLLKLKGIEEYLQSANTLLDAENGSGKIEFHIVGEHRNDPAYINANTLRNLTQDPNIFYHGSVDPKQIENFIGTSSCVVLPTYYGEGVPRVLLEASASGRPIITTDNPGSRDVIEHERNGFSITSRNVKSLVAAMQRFTHLSYEEKTRMGQFARQKVESEFDETIVIDQYLRQINQIAKER